ncbi:MAG: hypothetical protein HKN43_05225, partial [Rhodothermales bacterium]|nr:hypothetical protein [Rhodothermales bacterium]
LQDVVAVYDEMGTGTPFAEALETHIGVNLVEFEANYFDSVKAYLASS